jgi:hypothetical protein
MNSATAFSFVHHASLASGFDPLPAAWVHRYHL